MQPDRCDFRFSFHPRQRERFRDGSLVDEWLQRYPMLFDEDDARVLSTSHQRKYHFFEWLGAILLFEATGYLSLVEKYTSKSHTAKRHAVQKLLQPELFDWLSKNESGQPDLFVFQPVTKDWFFCEVKGGVDRLRNNQLEWVDHLFGFLASHDKEHSGRARVLCLQEIEP